MRVIYLFLHVLYVLNLLNIQYGLFVFEKNIQSDLTKQNMTKVDIKLKEVVDTFFFFFKIQPMVSALNDSSLLSNKYTNRFLM